MILPKTKKLFISYRSSDAAKVDKIARDLALLKHDDGTPCYITWQDKHNLPPASPNWWDAIVDAIEQCDIFVFHLSRESLQSAVCMAELDYAHRRNRPIIPVVLEGEFDLKPIAGKYDLPAQTWALVPNWLRDVQLLFYNGASFFTQFREAVELFERNPLRDIPALRPMHPNSKSAHGNNHALYNAACDYAGRLAFVDAENHFIDLVRRNDRDYADFAELWLKIIRGYAELIEIVEQRSPAKVFNKRWSEYRALFPNDVVEDIFDPKNFAERDRIAWKKAEAQRLAREKAERDRLIHEKAEAERLAHEKAEKDRFAREDAERNRIPWEKMGKGLFEHENAEVDRIAWKKAEKDRFTREDAERNRIAWEKAEADRLAREKAEAHRTAQTPRELHALNPFDWLRLYFWLFFKPNLLNTYTEHFEETSMRATGTWLSLTMCLLPLFIPSLAASVGTLEWQSTWEWVSPALAVAVVVGLWLVNGFLAYFDINNNIAGVVAFVLAFGVAGVVVFGVAGVVAGGVAGVVAFVMALFVAFVLTFGVAFGVAGIVAGVVAGGVAFGVALVAVSVVAVSVVAVGVAVSVAVSVAAGVALMAVSGVVVVGVARMLRARMEEGEASIMSVLVGLAVPVSLAFLVEVSFFGWGA